MKFNDWSFTGKMKKAILFLFITSVFYNVADGQITKGSWLVGGNADFSTFHSAQYKQINFQIAPLAGYFLWDKFAAGLNPSLTYANNSVVGTGTIINIGPFVRYYFLDEENIVNLFAGASYTYGRIRGKTNGQDLNTFSFSGGPVIYFNSSVGLEFIITYNTTKSVKLPGSNNEIKFGIGFQIHLGRDK